MRSVINSGRFQFRMNTAFEEVITNCKNIFRKDQEGTWINEDIIKNYTRLFKTGYAFSAEAWQNNELAGGLYGLKIGRMLFGESMFSKVSNASKFAFISLIKKTGAENIRLIDCQVYTPHLESLGAEMIARKEYIQILEQEMANTHSI